VFRGLTNADAVVEMASFMAVLQFTIEPFVSAEQAKSINADFADKLSSPTVSGKPNRF